MPLYSNLYQFDLLVNTVSHCWMSLFVSGWVGWCRHSNSGQSLSFCFHNTVCDESNLGPGFSDLSKWCWWPGSEHTMQGVRHGAQHCRAGDFLESGPIKNEQERPLSTYTDHGRYNDTVIFGFSTWCCYKHRLGWVAVGFMPSLSLFPQNIHLDQLVQEVSTPVWTHAVHVSVWLAIRELVVDLRQLHAIIQDLVVAAVRVTGQPLRGLGERSGRDRQSVTTEGRIREALAHFVLWLIVRKWWR